MSQATPLTLPLQGLQAGFRRFTVPEYHNLIRMGVLTEDDNLELIEGYLVHKMSRNPPHDGTILRINNRLVRLLPAGWQVRIQSAITLPDSEPEPDGAVVRGGERSFDSHHPGAADTAVVIEVADSTLTGDRADKGRVYAKAGIREYWIVNLADSQIEVYTLPSGPGVTPGYGSRQDYPAGSAVPLVLDGQQVGSLLASDILP
jgi:Uma2 family endonuclease